jgi:hypothetical protein
MSIFFAAPLLCIHPLSFRLNKEQILATKICHARELTAEGQKSSDGFPIRASDRLAQSLLRSRKVQSDLPANDAIVPAVYVEGQEEHCDHNGKCEIGADQAAKVGGDSTVTQTFMYY